MFPRASQALFCQSGCLKHFHQLIDVRTADRGEVATTTMTDNNPETEGADDGGEGVGEQAAPSHVSGPNAYCQRPQLCWCRDLARIAGFRTPLAYSSGSIYTRRAAEYNCLQQLDGPMCYPAVFSGRRSGCDNEGHPVKSHKTFLLLSRLLHLCCGPCLSQYGNLSQYGRRSSAIPSPRG